MNVKVFGTQWFYRDELDTLIAMGRKELLWRSALEVAALTLSVLVFLCWTSSW